MKDTTFSHPDDVWLLNLGYVSDHSEQNLMLYGHLSAPGVLHVELMIEVEKKRVSYAVVLDNRARRRYKLQRWLESKPGLLGKLGLLCFLRILGSYDPASRISRCIRDYAGPSWSTSTEVLGVKQYLEITSSSRGKGWVFKNGLDDSTAVPRQDRPSTTSSTGG